VFESINCANFTGSGLPRLQRWFLTQALKNRMAEGRNHDDSRGADLYYGEVLAGFYEFPYEHPKNPEMDMRQFLRGHQVFKPDLIGRARYSSACAAVSRAVRRLQSRGLAVVLRGRIAHWAGINLTAQGQALDLSFTEQRSEAAASGQSRSSLIAHQTGT
jgi:hypothetical protein